MHSVAPISHLSASSPASRSSGDGGESQGTGPRIQAQSSQGPSSQPDVFEHVPASTLPGPVHDPQQLSVNFANKGPGDPDSFGTQESAFHLHLRTCLKDSSSVWKQPWQTGLLQQQPGAKRPRPKGPLPLVQLEQAPVESSYGSEQPRSEGLEAVCAKLAKCKHDSWEQMQSEERNLAVNKWVRIVATSPMSFQVARDFFASKASGLTTGNLADSVSDALSVKATSTVHSRANSIIRFVSWAKSASVQAFPATEGVVYHYFEQLKDSAAPTTFRSFLSALGFAKHVFGLLEAEKVYFSGRVKGLADKLYCAKARLRQRSPLRVSDVERLEQICMGTIARSAPDRVAAGFFLFLVYARARFSDGQRVCSLSLASGSARFLEAKVSRSKTSYTLERKTRYLPMAAPAFGVTAVGWSEEWLKLLATSGIKVAQDRPLLPAPGSAGMWKNVPLPCDQACVWLRSLLQTEGPQDAYLENVGTHSLKRTLLSWSSKRGLPRDMRAILGYHTSRGSGVGTELIYEADAQSAPLRELERMLEEIRKDIFRPDMARGEQLQGEAGFCAPPQGVDFDPHHSSSESSCDEEEPDHDENERSVEQVVGPWQGRVDLSKLRQRAPFFRHRHSRVLHLGADEAGSLLLCGRTLNSSYVKCPRRPDVLHPRCKQCFKDAIV